MLKLEARKLIPLGAFIMMHRADAEHYVKEPEEVEFFLVEWQNIGEFVMVPRSGKFEDLVNVASGSEVEVEVEDLEPGRGWVYQVLYGLRVPGKYMVKVGGLPINTLWPKYKSGPSTGEPYVAWVEPWMTPYEQPNINYSFFLVNGIKPKLVYRNDTPSAQTPIVRFVVNQLKVRHVEEEPVIRKIKHAEIPVHPIWCLWRPE